DPALRPHGRAPVQRARRELGPGGRGAALGPARRDLTGAPMTAHTVHQVLEALTTPDPAARPMMRWWWFGPDLDRGEIDRELRAVAAAGLGGAAVALVSPLRPGAPRYRSPEVPSHLPHAAERACELGVRLAVTLGSGWSDGGAHFVAEHSGRGLRWERPELEQEALHWDVSPSWPG